MSKFLDKFECILCKYKHNKTESERAIQRATWHCPTLQNIYYGKFIDYQPFKTLHKIRVMIDDRKVNEYYESFSEDFKENDDVKFIFGIKAYNDLCGGVDANLLTMNDFDVIYNKKNHTYSWSVEYLYSFDTIKGKKKYLKHLLEVFTKFMKEKGYDTNYDGFCGMFSNCTEFDTLEECYANFKYCTNGYINS